MKRHTSLALLFSSILGLIFLAGCTDNLTSSAERTETLTSTSTSVSGVYPRQKLRNVQLLDAAWSTSNSLGKGDDDGAIVKPDLFAYVGYNSYMPNGITPRILDEYSVTNRILEEYGVTRRVLEDYGITRRVLEDYGITRRVLEDYGITRRVLEDYGITQRLLDDYSLTWDDFAAIMAEFDPSVKARSTVDGGISIWIRGADVDAILEEMMDDPDIGFVEPDPEAEFLGVLGRIDNKSDKDMQFYPWGVERIFGGKLNEKLGNSHVYVLDSGVLKEDLNVESRKDFTMLFLNRNDMEHEEDNWVNPGFFDPGNDGNPEDENGHGTHVAGTLAALNNDEGVIGTAPGLKIHSMKVLTAEGRTDVTTIVAALNYVIHQRLHEHDPDEQVLINLSLGMDIGTTAYNVLDETVAKAVKAGIIVVVAAGNDDAPVNTYSPAHVVEAITVGAYDQRNKYARFSNWGEGVDILAPGNDIVSLPRTKEEIEQNIRVLRSGTSMAAPHVTAAAALYWAEHPNLTPEEVLKGLIENSDEAVDRAPSGTTTRGVMLHFASKVGFDKAQWKEKDRELKIKGIGPIYTDLEIRTHSGVLVTTVQTDGKGKFKLEMENAPVAPCAVVIREGASSDRMIVEDAPADCVE